MIDQATIQEGTLSFWTKEGQLLFNDSKSTPIYIIDPTGGSIFVVKDDDNKMKFVYVVNGKGRIDLAVDVSALSGSQRHFFVFTWDLENKKLCAYIDGKIEGQKEISF